MARKQIKREIRLFIRKKYYRKYKMNSKDLNELNDELMKKVENYDR